MACASNALTYRTSSNSFFSVGATSPRHGLKPTLAPAVWRVARFERRGEDWWLILEWELSGDRAGWQPAAHETFALYQRKNLDPWTTLYADHSGLSAEVPLRNWDQEACCWFCLRHGQSRDDITAESALLGPLVPPSAPGPVEGLRVAEVAPGTVSIAWLPPAQALQCSTDVVDYEVLLENERQQQAVTVCVGTELTVSDLIPNHCYTVQVCAVNEFGRGPFCIAPRPLDIREVYMHALPLDNCPPHSWSAEKMPTPAEARHEGCLEALTYAGVLLGTLVLDMEFAIALCYGEREGPWELAQDGLLLCVYLVAGAFASPLVDVLEDIIPPSVIPFVAKLLYTVLVSTYHYHVYSSRAATSGAQRGVVQFRARVFNRIKKDLWFHSYMLFLVILRGLTGMCAGIIRYHTAHLVLKEPHIFTKASWFRWSADIVRAVLLSKGLPLGFLLVILLVGAEVPWNEACSAVATSLLVAMLLSSVLGIILGPHGRRPAVAVNRHRVSTPAVLRRYVCLCEAEARRAIDDLLPPGDGTTCEARSQLLRWGGPQKPLWVWNIRNCTLLDDQALLLGLHKPHALSALAALLRRQLTGAEDELIACFDVARLANLKIHNGSEKATELSGEAGRLLLAILTVAAALPEPEAVQSLQPALVREASQLRAPSASLSMGRVPYNVSDVHEALVHVADLCPAAIPSADLATTVVVARSSSREWLRCLGCRRCCSPVLLQQRLRQDNAIRSLQSQEPWHGSCPSWSQVLLQTGSALFTSLKESEQQPGACPQYGLLTALERINSRRAQSRRASIQLSDFSRPEDVEPLSAFQASMKARHGTHWEGDPGANARRQLDALAWADAANSLCSEVAWVARGLREQSSLIFAIAGLVLQPPAAIRLESRFTAGLSQLLQRFWDSKTAAATSEAASPEARRVLEALLRTQLLGLESRTLEGAYDCYTLLAVLVDVDQGHASPGASGADIPEQTSSLSKESIALDAVQTLRDPNFRPSLLCRQAVVLAIQRLRAIVVIDEIEVHNCCSRLLPHGVCGVVAKRLLAVMTWLAALREELSTRAQDGQDAIGTAVPDDAPSGNEDLTEERSLRAALALGFRSTAELTISGEVAALLSLHFGARGDDATAASEVTSPVSRDVVNNKVRFSEDASQPALPDHSSRRGSALNLSPVASRKTRAFCEGSEVCLGAVLNLLEAIGGPSWPQHLLHSLETALEKHSKWQPFMTWALHGKACDLLATIAAKGIRDVAPWAPNSRRHPVEAFVTQKLVEFFLRIARTGFLPPPPSPDSPSSILEKNDHHEKIVRYWSRFEDGFLAMEDAMLLIDKFASGGQDRATYHQICDLLGCQRAVGLTVQDGRLLLNRISSHHWEGMPLGQDLALDVDLSPGGRLWAEMERSRRQSQDLSRAVSMCSLRTWGLTDTLALWLTHFFGAHSTQQLLEIYKNPQQEASNGSDGAAAAMLQNTPAAAKDASLRLLAPMGAWSTPLNVGGEVRKRLAELRGVAAMHGRPAELAKAWRTGAERAEDEGLGGLSPVLVRKRRLGRFSSNASQVYPFATTSRNMKLAMIGDGVSFHTGFCHARTYMSPGGLRRDEASNLARLRRRTEVTWLTRVGEWCNDHYAWPALVHSASLAIVEVAFTLLWPYAMVQDHRQNGEVDRLTLLLLIFLVPFMLFLGQAVGMTYQHRRMCTVHGYRLDQLTPTFLASAEQNWESDCLAAALLSLAGGALYEGAWLHMRTIMGSERELVRCALLASSAFVFGLCRPLVEMTLMLHPRHGHHDGRVEAPTLNVSFLLRTLAAAFAMPVMLRRAPRGLEGGNSPRHLIFVLIYVLTGAPSVEATSPSSAGLLSIVPLLDIVPFLALVLWTSSALHDRPYANPVRRALHYCEPSQSIGSGGPLMDQRPIVTRVQPGVIMLRWQAPSSTRPMYYDLEVSVEHGRWKSGEEKGVKGPLQRPCCSVPVSSIPPGGAARFRVRCALVPMVAEDPPIWGPWSQPSLLVHRPRGMSVPSYLRPVLSLVCAPLSLINLLLVSFPQAFYSHIGGDAEKAMFVYAWRFLLLLVIWPIMLIHVLVWWLPFVAMQWTKAFDGPWHTAALCATLFLMLPVLPANLLLQAIHYLLKEKARIQQVEDLAVCDEFGPAFKLRIRGGKDSHELPPPPDVLRVVSAASTASVSWVKASDVKLHFLSRFASPAADPIEVSGSSLRGGSGSTLEKLIDARVVLLSWLELSALSVVDGGPCAAHSRTSASTNAGLQRQFENAILLLPPATSFKAEDNEEELELPKLQRLIMQAHICGAVAVLVDDTYMHANSHFLLDEDAFTADVALLCISAADASLLQGRLADAGSADLIVGLVGLCCKGTTAQALEATWSPSDEAMQHFGSSSADGGAELARDLENLRVLSLQYRPAATEVSAEIDRDWVCCAFAVPWATHMVCSLPIRGMGAVEFRLLGVVLGCCQPLSFRETWASLALERDTSLPSSKALAPVELDRAVSPISDEAAPTRRTSHTSAMSVQPSLGSFLPQLSPSQASRRQTVTTTTQGGAQLEKLAALLRAPTSGAFSDIGQIEEPHDSDSDERSPPAATLPRGGFGNIIERRDGHAITEGGGSSSASSRATTAIPGSGAAIVPEQHPPEIPAASVVPSSAFTPKAESDVEAGIAHDVPRTSLAASACLDSRSNGSQARQEASGGAPASTWLCTQDDEPPESRAAASCQGIPVTASAPPPPPLPLLQVLCEQELSQQEGKLERMPPQPNFPSGSVQAPCAKSAKAKASVGERPVVLPLKLLLPEECPRGQPVLLKEGLAAEPVPSKAVPAPIQPEKRATSEAAMPDAKSEGAFQQHTIILPQRSMEELGRLPAAAAADFVPKVEEAPLQLESPPPEEPEQHLSIGPRVSEARPIVPCRPSVALETESYRLPVAPSQEAPKPWSAADVSNCRLMYRSNCDDSSSLKVSVQVVPETLFHSLTPEVSYNIEVVPSSEGGMFGEPEFLE